VIKTDNLLALALSQAIETMAFLDIVPAEDDLPIPENTVLSQISFANSESGTIQMLAGLDFCKLLAENIGALDEVNDEDALDAFKELANVTCGLFLPMIAHSLTEVFDMTVPTIKTGDESPRWDDFTTEPNGDVWNVEGHLVAVRLIIKD